MELMYVRVQTFQHTAARRRLGVFGRAGGRSCQGFNTQPPEGGWGCRSAHAAKDCCFNTQPPEGGWIMRVIRLTLLTVSTHSRPKAAGIEFSSSFSPIGGFNTQPPEGGWVFGRAGGRNCQCFNTQPPEGGWPSVTVFAFDNNRFQHTAARRRLVGISLFIRPAHYVFQHTAARRRLDLLYRPGNQN